MIQALRLDESISAPEARALPHVLLVVDQFPKTLGGGERVALSLAELLPRYGYRASILTFFVHPESSGLNSAPCPVYLLPLERTYDWKAMFGAFALGRFLREQNVCLVQTFFESSDLWAGFVTRALSDAKLIWSRRDMGILRGRKHELGYRMMAGMPDKVLAVSDQVRRHAIEVDGIDPERVETVYSGLDLAKWSTIARLPKASDEMVVTTVGNIRRVKGHDVLVRAASMLAPKFPGVRFSVAGGVLEPEYFRELELLQHELGLVGRLSFCGGVSDLPSHLSRSDVFVLPSRSEGFSNSIIEAMAAGLPVVATNVGGNAEAVQDGVNGFIVPSDDAEALAAAIAKLVGDPALALRMGEAGREIAAKRFTTEAMMTHTAGIYARLLT